MYISAKFQSECIDFPIQILRRIEFNADILRFAARGTVFTNLVHNVCFLTPFFIMIADGLQVRVVYMPQILLQQQLLAEQSAQYDADLIEEREQQPPEFTVRREQLTTEHDHELPEMIENHNLEVAQPIFEVAQPIVEVAQPIPEVAQPILEPENAPPAPRGWITNIEVGDMGVYQALS